MRRSGRRGWRLSASTASLRGLSLSRPPVTFRGISRNSTAVGTIGWVKLQLMSDLHLEVHPDYRPKPAPGADWLVLAGDIGSYQVGSRLGLGLG